MTQDLYRDILGIPSPSETSPEIFSKLITDTVDQVNKRFKVNHHRVPDEPFDIIYLSYFLVEQNEWKAKFTHFKKLAFNFFQSPPILWATIATGLYTPTIGEAYKKINPSFDPGKYLKHTSTTPAPQKIGPELTTKLKRKSPYKRGELWKLDRRWDHLWPSSRKIFLEILRRTQYPKRPENFPWCQAGVKSLKKFTGVSERQVRRALIQLERSKLIKRIVRGYKDQGASRYRVFLVPAMSGAFSWKSLHAKKNPRPKKRIRRIS
jgi:hypothetical protein